MNSHKNVYGQPVGAPMPHWSERPMPASVTLQGRYCRLEPLDAARHGPALYSAYRKAPDDRDWTYLFIGPFPDEASFLQHLAQAASSADRKHYAVIDLVHGSAVGSLALMRADVRSGSIEVGAVAFSPLLRQTPASTEAQFLLMAYVFDDLGYRRYEWKCDSLNSPSCQAAERLGFTFEGIFRQVVVYKGRSRDTAWHSIIDPEWPTLKAAFQAWLAPENFNAQGRQRRGLQQIRQETC